MLKKLEMKKMIDDFSLSSDIQNILMLEMERS